MSQPTTHAKDRLPQLSELKAMSVPALKEVIAYCLGKVIPEAIRVSAWAIRLLEEAGEDTTDLVVPLIHHIRRVAYDQLLPEIVTKYMSRPRLITLVGSLPLPDQERIARGEPVKVMVQGPIGQLTHRLLPVEALTPEQVCQVFSRDHIRDEAEQVAILEQRQARARKPRRETVGRIEVDHERDGLIIGRTFYSRAEVRAALTALER